MVRPPPPQCLTSLPARRIASELIRLHGADRDFSARRILDDHPDLWTHKSAVLDLVCEEVSRRFGQAEPLDSQAFAARFPEFRSAVIDHIEVYRALASALDAVEPDWPAEGDVFLGFSLLEEIGRGAFSRVFLAREPELGDRPIVLKVCRQAGDEARLLGRLEHEAIVPIHAVRTDPDTGLACVIMPWCGKATLRDVLDFCFARGLESGPGVSAAVKFFNASTIIPIAGSTGEQCRRGGNYTDVLLAILSDVCNALIHAHESGVVHADVKPSNVLVSSRLRGILLDFNLSQDSAQQGRVTGGTVTHMAPELLEQFANGQMVTPAEVSDVYAWGTMLCECFAPSGPYGAIPAELAGQDLARWCLERHRLGLLQFPATEPSIARLIRRCMAADPLARPQSMQEVQSLLTREQTRPKQLTRRMRAHRRMSAAAITILLGAIAYGAIHAATRPAEHVRLMHAAARAAQAGDLEEAIEFLDDAESALPDAASVEQLTQLRVTRGLYRIDAGQFRDAYSDFSDASISDSANPEPVAWAAYALSTAATLERNQLIDREFDADIELALHLYRRSEQMLDAPTPELRFNIAYCCLLKKDLNAAEAIAGELCAEGRQFHNALHLKAFLDMQRSMQGGGPAPDPAWIEAAISLEPASRQYWFDASCIYLRLARSNDNSRADALDRAVECWEMAIARGATRDEAGQLLASYPELAENPRFRNATASASERSTMNIASRFLEPLPR